MKKAIFCVLMTLLFFACGKGQGDNTPKGVVTQYAEAIIHGKYLEALNLVYFEGSEDEVQELREKFANLCEEVAETGMKDSDRLVSYEIGEVEEDEEEGKATVVTTLSYADGHSKTDTLKLRKDEQGQWFIDEEE
jgi:hypothetical protein